MAIIHDPRKIEAKSFEIIDGFLKKHGFPKPRHDIVRRVIHTTVDRRYARDLIFSKNAIERGVKAIRNGAPIIVDSSMVQAGINKKITARFGNRIICRMREKAVAENAAKMNLTRAIVAMRSSAKELNGAIAAIGNAPTALFELSGMIKNSGIRPALVVGIPVGFVGAAESKKLLRTLDVDYITNRSKKGGSTVAAAIVNALLILANKKGG